MKTIQISKEVWNEIIKKGRFGETTEDDVLRRILGINKLIVKPTPRQGKRTRKSTVRMSATIVGNELVVQFANGISRSWNLPDRQDKAGIRLIRDSAVSFATIGGATFGQQNAVKKTLTDAGYYVSR